MQSIIMKSWTFKKNDCIAAIIHIHCNSTNSDGMIIISNEGINDTDMREKGSNIYAATLKCKRFIDHGWEQIEHKAYSVICYEQSCHHLIEKLNDLKVCTAFHNQVSRALKRIGVSFSDMQAMVAYNQQFGDWA